MHIYLTDANGKKHWNTEVTAVFSSGERANFERRLANAKAGRYPFVDAASARIVEELSDYDKLDDDMSDDELLAALGL
jgi:hypothetical protein